jgi:methanogenic corrinoid protein MtbC1
LADLSVDELAALVEEDRREAAAPLPAGPTREDQVEPAGYLTECLDAVRALDGDWLRTLFGRAVISLNPNTFIDSVATPLMHEIGQLWAEGRLTPGHEHLASMAIRATLAEVAAALQPSNGSPRIVVATPSGQRHGIGATLVAATAQLEGWFVTHLGEDLPAADIARAADQCDARAVALSITYPADDPNVVNELRMLRQALSNGVDILVGGQAVDCYSEALTAAGARKIDTLSELRAALREINGSSSQS